MPRRFGDRGALLGALLGLAGFALWLGNRSPAPEGDPPARPRLLAHRGMAQEYHRDGLTGETCTAARMLPPRHGFLENTLDGVAEAFRLGAALVEVDVQPTTDGHWVVFHDWTLDCRTDGHGVTRDQPLALLRGLDVGHGYTADGGRSFPFRGRFVGAMPTLEELLAAFPGRRLLLNLKGGDAEEGRALAAWLRARPELDLARLSFSGAEAPVAELRGALGARTLTKEGVRDCLGGYLLTGWTGHVPAACRHGIVYLPVNVAPWMWGWDRRFLARMQAADAEVWVIGPYTGGWSDGLDEPADLARLPPGFAGGISTDRLDVVREFYGS